MTNASQEFNKLETCPEEGMDINSRREDSSKMRLACSPVIQVTWRATEYSKDACDSAQQCHQTPLRRQPRQPHLVNYHSASSGSGSLSSSSGSAESACGVYRSAWRASPRWFLGSPRVQQLKTSESSSNISRSDWILQSDLKGMHLSQSYGCNELLNCSHQSSSGGQTEAVASPAKRPVDHQQLSFNPFELDLVNTMHMSSYSPSVLSKCGTPTKSEQRPDGFSWDIEHIAILYPKELDSCPDERNPTPTYDPEMEDKIQNAINNFFAHSVHMPSPWPENGSKNKVSSTPASMTVSDGEVCTTKKPAVCKDVKRLSGKQQSVWCQTVLSLPTNFDLEDVLKDYFTFTENQVHQKSSEDSKCEEYEVKEANLSTSSLRRKLFANIEDEPSMPALTKDTRSQSIVPTRNCAIVSVSYFQDASSTPEKLPADSGSPETPDKFTSSPVSDRDGWHQRASLTPPMDVASPAISPIKLSNMEKDHLQPLILNNYVMLHHTSLAESAISTEHQNLEEPLEAEIQPHWLEVPKQANISKISFMETADDMGSTMPNGSGSGTVNHDTGYLTQPRLLQTMSSASSCQELTSFSTSIQAPLQMYQQAIVAKTPPSTRHKLVTEMSSFQIVPKDLCKPTNLKERNMSISSDDLPSVAEDPQTANEDATMWSPLVASTPSRKHYLITEKN